MTEALAERIVVGDMANDDNKHVDAIDLVDTLVSRQHHRRRLGLTQLELAVRAGIADNTNTLRALERASKRVHQSTIRAIAHALGLLLEELTGATPGCSPRCPMIGLRHAFGPPFT